MKNKVAVTMFLLFCFVINGTAFAADNKPIVLFDQGHNQRFLIEKNGDLQLSKLADTLRITGLEVLSTTKPLSDETLNGVSALVISGPFETLKSEEIEAVIRFIENGGQLAAMLHIGSPLSGLLDRLDVDHSNVVLHERKNVIDADTNFTVVKLSTTPFFAGMTQFSTYGCWALNPGKNANGIAQTSSEAWVDMDGDKKLSKGDMIGAFSVVVSGKYGAGRFVVFGDDAIFQNRYLDENNRRLALNIAGWMMGQ